MAAPKPKNSPLFEAMFGKKEKEGRIVSYDCVPPMLLGRLCIAVVDAGGACLIGTTRDRGAWAITFMHDSIPNKRSTDYCSDPDGVCEWIEQWVQNWEALADSIKDSK